MVLTVVSTIEITFLFLQIDKSNNRMWEVGKEISITRVTIGRAGSFTLTLLRPASNCIGVSGGSMLGRCLIINIETRTAAEVIYVCLPVVNHTFMSLAGRALCSDLTSTISSLAPRLACKVKHMR